MANPPAVGVKRELPLPSLHALHVFEVAARLGSFTQAAVELGVTQTAVSHQIKQLEAELDVLLFRRTGRALVLTAPGQAWYTSLSKIFERLRSVNVELRQRKLTERPVVSLTTMPSFGSRWLVPRLGSFLAQHPELELRISTSERIVDFSKESIDVGIRFGSGRYPGLFCEKLLDDWFVVVAAPSRAARLRKPADLLPQTLLFDDHEDAWTRLFVVHVPSGAAPARRHQLTDSGMLVEAACRGQGVALARWSLVQDELRSGRLVRLFPRLAPLPTGHSYFLVGLRESFRRSEVSALRDWLRHETKSIAPP